MRFRNWQWILDRESAQASGRPTFPHSIDGHTVPLNDTMASVKPIDKALALVDPQRCSITPEVSGGYVNVLAALPPASTIGARTMRTSFYPVFYERLRPLGLRLASGLSAPGRDGDRAQLSQRLGLTAGQSALDVGCGPGNFTGFLARAVGPSGVAVGLDASDSMLSKAVATNGAEAAYLRGDAESLPFQSDSFDAVCCLAALYLMNDPYAAIAESVRVLRPGGRIAILTSYSGSDPLTRFAMGVVDKTTGIRRFGRTDITNAFNQNGLIDVRQEIQGLAQAVWARKSDGA